MNFLDLYKENRRSVVETLRQLWCSETVNESQKAYAKRIADLLPELFAPSNAVPLVQCMNLYKPVYSVDNKTAEDKVGGYWDKIPKEKYYPPYEHQYLSWKYLLEETPDGKPNSICVTTGTGSGKTECFMLPLVYDLDRMQKANPGAESYVQALFLYPLNALMEDQKERLEQLLEGTNLTYAVYNGDLPEREPGENDHSDDAEKIRKQIRQIRGWDEETQTYRFKHILYTRDQVRNRRPNILLTNPTMLEYVLLRRTDERLIVPEVHSLQWVAIDETHTYTGAGAAELAMLLRRVLLAFDVKAEDIHFATSSATFGNADTIQDPELKREEKKADERKLQEFIAGITRVNPQKVKVIDGERIGEDKIPDNEDKARWERIFKEDFVTLSSLFPSKSSIEEQLKELDKMVERLGDSTDMKVKVHFFYRIPNNGLYVRLDQINDDGTFQIYTENKLLENPSAPLIELSRCKNCGEYVAIVRRNKDTGAFSGLEHQESDIFDLDEIPADGNYELKVLTLSNARNKKGQGNTIYKLNGSILEPALPDEVNLEDWHIVTNQHNQCPYCNCRLTKHSDNSKDLDAQTTEEISEEGRLTKFRLSAEFISRVMAPSILDQLDKFDSNNRDELLHDGQQYLSFADSRQLAAKATLKQNQEQERMWFYTTIYHELCKKSAEAGNSALLDDLNNQLDIAIASKNRDEIKRLSADIANAENNASNTAILTWPEVAELLLKDKYCNRFCYEFVKRNVNSDETDSDGVPSDEIKMKYVQSIMTMYLTSRHRSAAAPETMGLFTTYYKKLEDLPLPNTVDNTFNRIIQNPDNKISDEDWRALLQIYLDFRVRSDQSVYLEQNGLSLDIFDTVRFATEKSHRSPALKPSLNRNNYSTSRIVRYLCALLRKDNPSLEDDRTAYRTHFDAINVVVNALWKDLVETTKLLQVGRRYDDKAGRWTNDPDGGIRLNLADISFKLYEKVYLCDTNSESDDIANHAECLRPVEVNFKGFSPYLQGGVAVPLDENTFAEWEPYPYYIGSGNEKEIADIKLWAKEKRKNLWIESKELWGENGAFFDRLNDIHYGPKLFIQAEHTAQVDKMISRQLQRDFKNHRINILACSTTMEMGVDLGTLQVVMLSSVPPQPANYKQRAGRSGRNPKMVKSVCITLCGSDAIGLRTLFNPLETIINRTVEVPKVDLESPQVIQRHANAFLIRSLGVFGNGSVNQKVMDFYTRFRIEDKSVLGPDNRKQDPNTKLGDAAGTMYESFDNACSPSTIPQDVKEKLSTLLTGTCLEDVDKVITKAQEENKRCHTELNDRLDDIKCAWIGCTGNSNKEKKFRNKLEFEYMEILSNRLLSFWATHRFTPNANMPVSVLELDLDPLGNRTSWGFNTTSSNPSYTLREAIGQYAPGNSIVVDGVVYVARGIEFQNKYQTAKAFKRIARNNDETVIGDKVDLLPNKIEWWNNSGKYVIEMVEPVGFIPDINEENTRIIDKNKFTHVSAQLLDAKKWDDNPDDTPHLYKVHCNRDSGDAKILYYNEGIGFGYCLCTRCGRMVLEQEVAQGSTTADLPQDFNLVYHKKINQTTGLKENDHSKPKYHLAISGKEARMKCGASNEESSIRRNIIIGGLIQTDFSEIKFRHKGRQWMHDHTAERELLLTLGIVFTQSLVEILGKERNAVDFAILPFGHLCIFDTNPGGAGYSNQLENPDIMKKVIIRSKELLETAQEKKSVEFLLDKFTISYINKLNIQAALNWIAEEESI